MSLITASHISEIIERESKSGADGLVKKFAPTVAAGILLHANAHVVIAAERANRKSVDLALGHWVAEKTYPLVTATVAEFIFIRFNVALELLSKAAPLRISFDGTEEEVLLWLLTDYWHVAGCASWVCGLRDEVDEG